ncbi:MAG: clan AA aspartic protease [Bacteroidetes bacterium]|nr:MAG: clan AA aspartic protease [Bacteroidota bacterium]
MRKKISNIPLEMMNIEGDGYHLMIEAEVNNKTVRLLVDTGASKTVFDKTRLQSLIEEGAEEEFEDLEQLSTGLGTNSMQGQVAILDSLKIGALQIDNYPVVVLDMDHVNQSYEMLGDRGIDGVLGSDLLKEYDAVIYFKKEILKVYY